VPLLLFKSQVDVPAPEITSPIPSATVEFGTGGVNYRQLPDGVTWLDVTDRLRYATIVRGRQQLLGRTSPGSLSLLLDNRDGALNPANPSGLGFLPGAPVRVRAEWENVTYDRYYGFIDTITPTYPSVDFDAVVTVQCTDLFKYLNLNEFSMTETATLSLAIDADDTTIAVTEYPFGWPQKGQFYIQIDDEVLYVNKDPSFVNFMEATSRGVFGMQQPHGGGAVVTNYGFTAGLTGTRLREALRYIGVQSSSNEMDFGITELPVANDLTGSVLNHLQEVEETEAGFLFMGPDGNVVFQDRHHFRLISVVPVVVFSEDTDEPGYSDPMFDYGDTFLFNSAALTPAGADTPVVYTDSVSEDQYGRRTLPARSFLSTSANEAASAVRYYVDRFKSPTLRVLGLRAQPQRDSDFFWPEVLRLDLGGRMDVERTPRLSEESFTVECIVNGIRETITPARYEIVFDTAPQPETEMWVLGDAELGVLGSTTIVGY
jgi:hypothetical protein